MWKILILKRWNNSSIFAPCFGVINMTRKTFCNTSSEVKISLKFSILIISSNWLFKKWDGIPTVWRDGEWDYWCFDGWWDISEPPVTQPWKNLTDSKIKHEAGASLNKIRAHLGYHLQFQDDFVHTGHRKQELEIRYMSVYRKKSVCFLKRNLKMGLFLLPK